MLARRRPAASPRLLAFVVLGATLGAIAAAAFGALHGLTGEAHDALIRARNGDLEAPQSVVVVEVDPRTVAAQQGLPLDRTVYAKAIDRLTELGARAIAVDVQFTEPSGDTADDQEADEALLVAIEDTPVPVILATSQVLAGGDTDVFGGKRLLEPAGAVAAHSSLPIDEDRVIRRLDPVIDGIPSIAQATAQGLGRPGLPHAGTLLDPTIPATRVRTISLQDLVDRRPLSLGTMLGRVAVIGVTYTGVTGDDRQYVAGSSDRVFGVHAQAQAIDTALRGEPLRGASTGVAYLLALLVGAITALGTRRSLWLQLGLAVGTLVALVALSVVAVLLGLMLNPVPALVALIVGATGAMAVRAAIERQRRSEARATLGRFVPPGVVDDLLDGGTDGFITPQAQEASVLFCDLRGYTSLVANLPEPDALIAVLDAYLSAVTDAIHAHGGTVVSFQGDGVMAAFGTPVPAPDSAAQAVAAARELHSHALPTIREQLGELLPGAGELQIGVGVATGAVLAGTVGPKTRREYAVVGPTTNLAARLQALTKVEQVGVLVDDATAEALGGAALRRAHTGITLGDGGLRSLGMREIRGVPWPIEVWAMDGLGEPSPARQDA